MVFYGKKQYSQWAHDISHTIANEQTGSIHGPLSVASTVRHNQTEENGISASKGSDNIDGKKKPALILAGKQPLQQACRNGWDLADEHDNASLVREFICGVCSPKFDRSDNNASWDSEKQRVQGAVSKAMDDNSCEGGIWAVSNHH